METWITAQDERIFSNLYGMEFLLSKITRLRGIGFAIQVVALYLQETDFMLLLDCPKTSVLLCATIFIMRLLCCTPSIPFY
jgi:hypothetical protein